MKDSFKILLVATILFGLIYPLSDSIHFQQNDDWVYYNTVKNFLNGKIILDRHTESTLYAQAFIGTFFVKIFDINKLPVLTLLVSVLNFIIFTYTLHKFFIKKLSLSILIGLLLFFNPLHIYSALGFMTDNYFLLFLLLTVYFVTSHLRTGKTTDLVFADTAIFLGFFTRQLTIVLPVALAITLVLKKKYKEAILQFLYSGLLVLYFLFLFPKTSDMRQNESLIDLLRNTLQIKQNFTDLFLYLFYIAVFTFPFVFSIAKKEWFKAKLFIAGLLVVSVLLIALTQYSNAHLFYFRNTVQDKGFFYGSLLNRKYELYGAQIFYLAWKLLALFAFGISIAAALRSRARLLNFYTIAGVLYLGLVLVLSSTYDRYVLPLLPLFILGFLFVGCSFNRFARTAIGLFLVILVYLNYAFSVDFVLINNYMWAKSTYLVKSLNVRESQIMAGYAWRMLYYNPTLRYKYTYSYVEAAAIPDLSCCYKIYDSYEPTFPLSPFKDPKVYLYKRRF